VHVQVLMLWHWVMAMEVCEVLHILLVLEGLAGTSRTVVKILTAGSY